MGDNLLRHLYLGFIRLHVLYHADKESICGVELLEELQHHGYDVGPGTLYPVLHQLQRAGHLSCSTQVINGKQRKNMRITRKGKKLLVEARVKLKELALEILDDRDGRKKRGK